MFGRGRGYRWMYNATGLPGWARGYGFGRGWGAGMGRGRGMGNPYANCRWFPQMPRLWWTGMYGPVEWTPQGPQLTGQVGQTQQPPIDQPVGQQPFIGQPAQISKEEEIQLLKQEKEEIKKELEEIGKRLKELEVK